MDKIIYTGKVTKEELTQELNELLSRLLDDLIDKEKIGVDDK